MALLCHIIPFDYRAAYQQFRTACKQIDVKGGLQNLAKDVRSERTRGVRDLMTLLDVEEPVEIGQVDGDTPLEDLLLVGCCRFLGEPLAFDVASMLRLIGLSRILDSTAEEFEKTLIGSFDLTQLLPTWSGRPLQNYSVRILDPIQVRNACDLLDRLRNKFKDTNEAYDEIVSWHAAYESSARSGLGVMIRSDRWANELPNK